MKPLRVPIALLLLVVACGGEAASTTVATGAPAATTAVTTTAPAPAEPREVAFRAGGLDLAATLWAGGTTWVVLGHMLPADKSAWAPFAALLQEAGYSVLAYNNRGYDGSEGDREPFALDTDAAGAIAFAQENGAHRLVYGGASMNGANAMNLGAFYEFAAIFVLSGVRSFPSAPDAAGALFDVEEPILFVAAEDDGNAVADLDRFLDRAPGADAIVLDTGGHGTDMLFADPDLGPRILDWLQSVTS